MEAPLVAKQSSLTSSTYLEQAVLLVVLVHEVDARANVAPRDTVQLQRRSRRRDSVRGLVRGAIERTVGPVNATISAKFRSHSENTYVQVSGSGQRSAFHEFPV